MHPSKIFHWMHRLALTNTAASSCLRACVCVSIAEVHWGGAQIRERLIKIGKVI